MDIVIAFIVNWHSSRTVQEVGCGLTRDLQVSCWWYLSLAKSPKPSVEGRRGHHVQLPGPRPVGRWETSAVFGGLFGLARPHLLLQPPSSVIPSRPRENFLGTPSNPDSLQLYLSLSLAPTRLITFGVSAAQAYKTRCWPPSKKTLIYSYSQFLNVETSLSTHRIIQKNIGLGEYP